MYLWHSYKQIRSEMFGYIHQSIYSKLVNLGFHNEDIKNA
jgi:hypothetical protein